MNPKNSAPSETRSPSGGNPEAVPAPPALAQILFGDGAAMAWSISGPELRSWSEAYDDWLAEMGQLHGRKYAHDCQAVCKVFFQFIKKRPWDVTPDDARRFGDDIEEQGRSVRTVGTKTHYLGQFYQYAAGRGLGQRETGISNPFEQVKKEAWHKPASLLYLDETEAYALLEAYQRNLTLTGRRDYAFILSCLTSGLNFRELRELRWGEISIEPRPEQDKNQPDGNGVWMNYLPRNRRLPEECAMAIVDYLRKAGRLSGMQPGEFVFAPLARLGVQPTGLREDWNGSRGILPINWTRMLKEAAKWAGLRWDAINFRVLRNTAAYLRIQAGDPPAEIQNFLGFSSRNPARLFIRDVQHTKKPSLWAEPDPDRPHERPPVRQSWKENFKTQALLPIVQGVDVLETETPLLTLQHGIEHGRLLRDHLLAASLPLVEDTRTLASLVRGANRTSSRIRTLLPKFKTILEKDAREAHERRKLMELVARIERHQRGEEEEEGSEQ